MKYLTSDPEGPAAKGTADDNQQGESSVPKDHEVHAVEIPIMKWNAKSCDESLNWRGVREGKKQKCNLAATLNIQFTTDITKT